MNRKLRLLIVHLSICLIMLTGCWNYREIEKMAIVAGVAIDKENGEYLLTAEIIKTSGEKEVKTSSQTVEGKGETIFDAVRNVIETSGKKLYWSHAKVIIISQDIAREGIVQAIDWLNRDQETRMSLDLLISKEKTAKEVLKNKGVAEISAFKLYDTLTAEKNLSKAPRTAIYELVNTLAGSGKSATLPSVGCSITQGERTSDLSGTAMFHRDKLIDFLSGDDTKYFLFAIGKVKGGLLVQKQDNVDRPFNVSIEILKDLTKTKVKPVYSDGKLSMKMNIDVNASLGEIGGSDNLIGRPQQDDLKKEIEETLRANVLRVIKKVQQEYGSDIFGFGSIIKGDMPELWKGIEKDWDTMFAALDVDVNVHLTIIQSGLESKSIKVGD